MIDYEYWSPEQIILSKKYPFTSGQLRHLLLNRDKNGLQDVVSKIGKRLIFRMDKFDLWIDSKKKNAK